MFADPQYWAASGLLSNFKCLTANIPKYIQPDATLHSLLYLETALHVSGVTSTHHQERVIYFQLTYCSFKAFLCDLG